MDKLFIDEENRNSNNNQNSVSKNENAMFQNIKQEFRNITFKDVLYEFRWKILGAIIVLVIIAICGGFGRTKALIVNAINSDDQYVNMVKYGSLQYNSNYRIKDAFENYFGNPTWEHFTSTDNKEIVEFNGQCTYNGKSVNCTIQFEFNKTNSFSIYSVSFNDIAQNKLMQNGLLESIYNDAVKDKVPKKK